MPACLPASIAAAAVFTSATAAVSLSLHFRRTALVIQDVLHEPLWATSGPQRFLRKRWVAAAATFW